MKHMKNEASHSEFRERAVRYLSDEMGSDERRRFEQEMADDEEKQRIFGEFAAISEAFRHICRIGECAQRIGETTELQVNHPEVQLDTD
jgi:hypothetical protein